MRFDVDTPRPLPREGGHTDAAEKGTYWLDPEELIELVRLGPLVSIDLVVQDPEGRILVGLRNNQPARNDWFVPGGRVGKGESLDEAFRRIAHQELGLTLLRADARFLGVFEHFYENNFQEQPGLGTHYVALGHQIALPEAVEIQPDGQHERLRWVAAAELLADPRVHHNTRVYAELV